jgi:hypothetical protein
MVDRSLLEDSTWYRAMTLTERIASLRAVQHSLPDVEINAAYAGRRLQRWRSQPPFSTGCYFAQRLAMDGTSEDEFLYLLGEPIAAVHGRFPAPQHGWRSLQRRLLVPLPLHYRSQSHGVVKKL